MGAFMSHKQQVWWGRLRRQGMLRFVVLYGVVGWGGLGTAVLVAWMWFSSTKEYFAQTFLSQPFTLILACVLGGLMFGFLLWHVNEIRYKQALEDQASDQ